MKVLYHITGAITFVDEIPWVVEPIFLAQVNIGPYLNMFSFLNVASIWLFFDKILLTVIFKLIFAYL